jgi:hypothetical protein
MKLIELGLSDKVFKEVLKKVHENYITDEFGACFYIEYNKNKYRIYLPNNDVIDTYTGVSAFPKPVIYNKFLNHYIENEFMDEEFKHKCIEGSFQVHLIEHDAPKIVIDNLNAYIENNISIVI